MSNALQRILELRKLRDAHAAKLAEQENAPEETKNPEPLEILAAAKAEEQEPDLADLPTREQHDEEMAEVDDCQAECCAEEGWAPVDIPALLDAIPQVLEEAKQAEAQAEQEARLPLPVVSRWSVAYTKKGKRLGRPAEAGKHCRILLYYKRPDGSLACSLETFPSGPYGLRKAKALIDYNLEHGIGNGEDFLAVYDPGADDVLSLDGVPLPQATRGKKVPATLPEWRDYVASAWLDRVQS